MLNARVTRVIRALLQQAAGKSRKDIYEDKKGFYFD